MLELSAAGLLGATAGTVIAALAYAPLASVIVRRLRNSAAARAQPGSLDREMPLLLRAVLACDVIVFAALGYWLGSLLAG